MVDGLADSTKYLIGIGALLLAGLAAGHKHLRWLLMNLPKRAAWALAAVGLVAAALAALADEIGLSNSPGKLGTIQVAGIVADAVLFSAGLLSIRLAGSGRLPK